MDDTLTTCSFKLMWVIVSSKTKDLERLQSEMSAIQKESQSDIRFAEFDTRLNFRLDKLERDVIAGKKIKLNRDCIDYESNAVYTWKKSAYSGHSCRNSIKKKSFLKTVFLT